MLRTVGSWPLVLSTAGVVSVVAAQEPTPPPKTLPPSITGTPAPTVPGVSPAAGVQSPPATTAPAARFQDLQKHPPETVRAVLSVWDGANWLSRMHQPSGRFIPGLNPTLKAPLYTDNDLHQAFATRSLAEAARFSGQEEFSARATQAVLAMLSRTAPDAADATRRVPTAPSKECNRIGFASLLALAIYALPSPDDALTRQAEELCAFVQSQVGPDGAVQTVDQPVPDGANGNGDDNPLYPGLALQALAASNRAKPVAEKQAALTRAVSHYRSTFKTQPNTLLAAALLPGVADFCLQTKDATSAALAVELADHLCASQYTQSDARTTNWIGAFRSDHQPAAEPGADSVLCVTALVAAVQVTRQVSPDQARFERYRAAVLHGLEFARRLQFSDANADHFEKGFRSRFITGGVHLAPTDGTLRVDATAHLVTAQLSFLQSGLEERPK